MTALLCLNTPQHLSSPHQLSHTPSHPVTPSYNTPPFRPNTATTPNQPPLPAPAIHCVTSPHHPRGKAPRRPLTARWHHRHLACLSPQRVLFLASAFVRFVVGAYRHFNNCTLRDRKSVFEEGREQSTGGGGEKEGEEGCHKLLPPRPLSPSSQHDLD